MKEKKRARLKALVVAFVLVFAGFAALMTIPGPTTAEGPAIEAANQIEEMPYNSMVLNEGDNELLQEGDWYYMYPGDHRPDPETSIGFSGDPVMWAYAMKPDIAHINTGEINAVAIYEVGAHPADKYISVRVGDDWASAQNGTEVANYTYTPVGEGWHELEFAEPVEIEENKEYAVVVNVYDNGDGHFPAPCIAPAVYHGDWTWDAEGGWERLSNYGLDYSWLLELRIFAPPTIKTNDATDHTIDSVKLNADYTLGAEENVTVFFQYAPEGDPLDGRVGEATYDTSGSHNHTITGLDTFQVYDFRAIVENETDQFIGDVKQFLISPLTVTVLDSSDDSPIQDAWVSLSSTELLWEEEFETDANGEILYIHSVPIEDVEFSYSADHKDYDPADGQFTGPDYTISLDPRTEWPVIVGPILFEEDDEDVAVSGAEVTIDGIGEETSDLFGIAAFNVDFDPVGESFDATITHPDYNPKSVTFTVDDLSVGSGPIYLTNEVFNFTIGPVVNVDGDPLEGIRVRVEIDIFDPWFAQDDTGADGTVDFSVIHFYPSEEPLYLSLVDPNEVYMSKGIISEPDTTIELTERPTVTVGPIVNRIDKPIPNILINLEHQTEDIEIEEDYTDLDGMVEFTVDFDPTGVYFTANMTYDDFEEPFVLEHFQGAESGTIKIHIGPYGVVQIGPVRDNFNKFVTDATVALIYEGSTLDTIQTDENGLALFNELEFDPEGKSFTYRITHDDLDERVEGDFTGTHSGAISVDIGEEVVDNGDDGNGTVEEGISTTLLAGIGLLIIIIIIIVVIVMMKKKPGEEPIGEEEEPLFEEEEEPLFEEEEEPLFEEEEEEPLFEEEEEEPLFEEEEEEPLFEEEEEF